MNLNKSTERNIREKALKNQLKTSLKDIDKLNAKKLHSTKKMNDLIKFKDDMNKTDNDKKEKISSLEDSLLSEKTKNAKLKKETFLQNLFHLI